MDDYELGQQAFTRDEMFDATRSEQWRRGWKDAEDDNYNKHAYGRYDDVYNPLDFGAETHVA